MKTIYLFAEVHDHGLRNRRRSESPEPKEKETMIGILKGQPDNYWELATAVPDIQGEPIINDRPL